MTTTATTQAATPKSGPKPAMETAEILDIRNRFLARTQSADIYDVLDKMGCPHQCLDLGIRPLRDEWKICGPAVTARGTREPLSNEEFLAKTNREKWWKYDYVYPGCVLVIDSEGDNVTGHWGEMLSYGARHRGVAGVVIDGGTRDKTGIVGMDNWACFARYTTPIESDRRWKNKELQVPIFMTGTLSRYVRVDPGDWMFGDNDGVIVIPQAIVKEVLAQVEEISKNEELSRKAFAENKSIEEVFALYNRA